MRLSARSLERIEESRKENHARKPRQYHIIKENLPDNQWLGNRHTRQMKEKETGVFSVSEGDAYCRLEQESSIMLKAITKDGDPVELTKQEAVGLARALRKAADQID